MATRLNPGILRPQAPSPGAHGRRREPLFDTRPAADIVLAKPPPYVTVPWLPAGLPVLAAHLEKEGITSRIARFLDDPYASPALVVDAIQPTLWGDPPLAERRARIAQVAKEVPGFFEHLLSRLLAGSERVIGLSVWRNNVDVVLELLPRLRAARPDALIVLGGPESAESFTELQLDEVDVVVRGSADGVIVPVMRAALDGRPGDAAGWENVWVHPRHARRTHLVKKRAEPPPLPRVDYTRLVPLLMGDPEPAIPMLLNVGCPYKCGFCVNTNIYPDMVWGEAPRLVDEMLEVAREWRDAFIEPPPLRLFLCDATLNANAKQFDQLCRLMRDAAWPLRPGTIDGLIVIDARMTEERVRMIDEAGFSGFYFGLETASRRLRELIHKPGPIEDVARALETIARARDRRFKLDCGVIVGFPDETEAEFHETVDFLEWADGLDVFRSISVSPHWRTPAAMDGHLFDGATGDRKGLYWRAPTPGGDPKVRARRYLYVVEHFAHRFGAIDSPVMGSVVARTMLDPGVSAFWTRWDQRQGALLGLEPAGAPPPGERPGQPADPPPARPAAADPSPSAPLVAELAKVMSPAFAERAGGPWALESVAPLDENAQAALARFVSTRDARVMAVVIEGRSEEKKAFARTARFNVSYRDGQDLTFDPALMSSILRVIAASDPP